MKALKRGAALAGMAMMLAGGATTAQAGTGEGKLQVKLMGTLVAPDGKLKNVPVNGTGVSLAGADTKASDNFVPTLAIEYFVTPSISLETICCLTEHHVTGTGTLAGASLVEHAKLVPATLTAKFHLDTGAGFKPYVGAGPAYFIWLGDESGATTTALGAPKNHIDDKLGLALQAGFDFPLNDKGLSLSVDAKRYFINVTSHWRTAAGVEALRTVHKLNPWVVGAGLAYRF